MPDAVSVRQVRDLPPPSFTLHLAMDALGLGYTLPTTGRVRDFRPLDCAHAGRTIKTGLKSNLIQAGFYLALKVFNGSPILSSNPVKEAALTDFAASMATFAHM